MTRDCRNTERLLYLFRMGELTPDDRALLERHLTSCPECRAIRDELRANDTVLSPGRESLPRPSAAAPLQVPLAGSHSRPEGDRKSVV
jgi:anti-sigma factor RsiW